MAAPTKSEIDTLKIWSVFKHFTKHIAKYIEEARILYRVGCTVLASAQINQPVSGSGVHTGAISPDELAEALKIRLEISSDWNGFIGSKPNMTGRVRDVINDIAARHIAWDYYQAIIR